MVAIGFAVCVGQTGEPSNVHTHRQIQPLRVTGADPVFIGIAESRDGFDAGYRGWAVACLCLAGRIALDQLGEVDARSEFKRDVMRVARITVTRDLDSAQRGVVQSAKESNTG